MPMMDLRWYQEKIHLWCKNLGDQNQVSVEERSTRFLEEALELVQTCNLSREDAHKMVDYVYNRPHGLAYVEVGDSFVTLLALCSVIDIDAYTELRRTFEHNNTPEQIAKIKAAVIRKRNEGVGI